MALTSFYETTKAKLSSVAVGAGRVVFCRDTQELFVDMSTGERKQITDIIILQTEAERTGLVAPLTKFYYVVETSKLWRYQGSWVSLTADGAVVVQTPGQSTTAVMSQKAVTDALSLIETTETDLNNLPATEGTFYNPNGFTGNVPTGASGHVYYVIQHIAKYYSVSEYEAIYQECFYWTTAVLPNHYIRDRKYTSLWDPWRLAETQLLSYTGQSTTAGMTQKAITDYFAQKDGTYSEMTVGNATNATNATKATQDGSGNVITSYYLPKVGNDLVVGQVVSSLGSGKAFLDCAITATVSSGSYYFYNCSGVITVSGSSDEWQRGYPR